ncbi:MAG TPA: hypothetical protein VL049_16750 [Candidatus Dormibacteraeota bacterium]|nr:hypothetical protein [Candidatus Dormibacteraeota bacterium]
MLGEVQNTVEVDLVEARIFEPHLGQRDLLVERVLLLVIRRAVDGDLVEQRLKQASLACVELIELPLDRVSGRAGVGGLGLPGVGDDGHKQLQVLGLRRDPVEVGNELGFEPTSRGRLDRSTPGLPAPIVRIPPPRLALRPCAGDRIAACPAAHEPS